MQRLYETVHSIGMVVVALHATPLHTTYAGINDPHHIWPHPQIRHHISRIHNPAPHFPHNHSRTTFPAPSFPHQQPRIIHLA
jgi:hypothetical protein